jgi:hypothetical protein
MSALASVKDAVLGNCTARSVVFASPIVSTGASVMT